MPDPTGDPRRMGHATVAPMELRSLCREEDQGLDGCLASAFCPGQCHVAPASEPRRAANRHHPLARAHASRILGGHARVPDTVAGVLVLATATRRC